MKTTTRLWGRYIVLAVSISGLIFNAPAHAATNELSTFLQKGLLEEEANQDLAAAAKAYEAAVQHFEKDRRLAATAVFRLAEVYRKQGRTNEAAALHGRVVREFGDQKSLVEASRKYVPEERVQEAYASGRNNSESSSNPSRLVQERLEDAEAIRIYAEMVKNSPDLINGQTIQLSDMPARELGAPLHFAAQKGRIAVAEFLLANGADVNRSTGVSPAGSGTSIAYSPLHFAAKAGHKAMVQLLLRHGARINQPSSDGTTALHLAAMGGFVAVIEDLLKGGADVNATVEFRKEAPLHLAAGAGHRAASELLITHGAKVNAQDFTGRTPLIRAVEVPSDEVVSLLISKGADVNVVASGFTPLWHAVERKTSKIIGILLKNGAKLVDPEPGRTLLNAAIQTRYPESVALLLAHGADPNQSSGHQYEPTPLFTAFRHGPEIVELLLRAKADPNATNTGGATPLHLAAARGMADVVEVLIKGGASVDFRDAIGATPLMYAVDYGKLNSVETLLKHGANPNAINKWGQTPVGLVQNKSSGIGASSALPLDQGSRAQPSQIMELLKRFGGNENVQRAQRISLGGDGFKYPDSLLPRPVFYRHLHPANRFTLFEALATGDLSFPDLANLRIRRIKGEQEETERVDAEAALRDGDCSKDIELQWGDIIEVPRRGTAPLGSTIIGGVPETIASNLIRCTAREVTLIIADEKIAVKIRLASGSSLRPMSLASEDGYKTYPFFWLTDVVEAAPLRTSSDLSRVTVRRTDPATGKKDVFTFDLSNKQTASNLWLQNDDVVEVPTKPVAAK